MEKSIFTKRHRTIVERLRQAREQAGLKQEDVAKKLKKPQSYVSRCESGQHRIDVVELEAFAKLYGKSVGFFLR